MEHKFQVGDLVDYGIECEGSTIRNNTPGVIKCRTVLGGQPAYLVAWDDEFTEAPGSANRDIWPEDILIRLAGPASDEPNGHFFMVNITWSETEPRQPMGWNVEPCSCKKPWRHEMLA